MGVLLQAWRSGSMRAASDLLDVAPSSISRQIAQLEREIGATLIEHGSRQLRLTEAGYAVIEYYRARQTGVESLAAQLQDLAAARTGNVQMVLGEGFLGPALDDTLDDFMLAYPGLKLSVRVTDTTRMIKLLLDDAVHFGVGFHPTSHPQVVSLYRAPVPLMAIIQASHPMAKRDSIELTELCDQPLALMESSFRIRQMLDEAAADIGRIIAPVFTSNSIAMLIRMARVGHGMTVLPEFSAKAPLSQGEVRAIPLLTPRLQSVYVHILARRNRQMPHHIEDLAVRLRKGLLPSALAPGIDDTTPS